MATGTQRAYARHRAQAGLPGGTLRSVQKAIAAGRIRTGPDGSIDFEQADGEWLAVTRTRSNWIQQRTGDGGCDLQQAIARRMAAEADLSEIKVAIATGRLVPRAEGTKMFHQIGRIFAEARESMIRTLPPKLIGKTDTAEIEAIISNAMADAAERVNGEIRQRWPELLQTIEEKHRADLN